MYRCKFQNKICIFGTAEVDWWLLKIYYFSVCACVWLTTLQLPLLLLILVQPILFLGYSIRIRPPTHHLTLSLLNCCDWISTRTIDLWGGIFRLSRWPPQQLHRCCSCCGFCGCFVTFLFLLFFKQGCYLSIRLYRVWTRDAKVSQNSRVFTLSHALLHAHTLAVYVVVTRPVPNDPDGDIYDILDPVTDDT